MREGLAKGAKFSVVELKELPYVDITSQMYSIDNFNFQMKLLDMSLVVAPSHFHGLGLYTTRAVARGAEIFSIQLNGRKITSRELLMILLDE
jgi:hypothetical protein